MLRAASYYITDDLLVINVTANLSVSDTHVSIATELQKLHIYYFSSVSSLKTSLAGGLVRYLTDLHLLAT